MKSLKAILGIALSIGGLGTTAAVAGVSMASDKNINSEVEAVSTDKLYFLNNTGKSSTNWYFHHWGGSNNSGWPGDQMTKVADSATVNGKTGAVYEIPMSGWNDCSKFIIDNNNDWQTKDMEKSWYTNVSGNVFYYVYDGGNSLAAGWYGPNISTTLSVTFTSDVPEYVDIFIPGEFNNWSTDINVSKMTRVSSTVFTYSLNNLMAIPYEYKIVACYSNVSVVNYDKCVDGSNQTVTLSSSDNGNTKALSNRTYNFGSNFPVYSPTLSVTFTSAVPDYADIYLPGEFNNWSQDIAVSKMTRVSNTQFTYSLTNVIPGSYEYKVVACYSTATSVDFNHSMDANNQTISISSSGTISLGSRTYDFANNMPQTEVADGAVVTLTFASAIPNTVNIVYVGGLTNWGTTSERIAAGVMTPNAGRTVFTWTIPEHTFTGDYEYKIVAMSAYTRETSVYYDHIVYGNKDSNETLTIDTTTTNYALSGLSIDLVELAAYSFSEGFNFAMETPCSDPNADNKTAVSAIWGTWKSTFEGMPGSSKTEFANSDGSVITQARSNYIHCVRRYGLATWTGAPAASSSSVRNIINVNSNNAIIVVTAISVVSLTALGAFFILRKKKFER